MGDQVTLVLEQEQFCFVCFRTLPVHQIQITICEETNRPVRGTRSCARVSRSCCTVSTAHDHVRLSVTVCLSKLYRACAIAHKRPRIWEFTAGPLYSLMSFNYFSTLAQISRGGRNIGLHDTKTEGEHTIGGGAQGGGGGKRG